MPQIQRQADEPQLRKHCPQCCQATFPRAVLQHGRHLEVTVIEALEELVAKIAIAVVLGGGDAEVADAAAAGQGAADASSRALVNVVRRTRVEERQE